MRTRIAIGAGLVAIMLAIVGPPFAMWSMSPYMLPLRAGMTESEVEAVLGTPVKYPAILHNTKYLQAHLHDWHADVQRPDEEMIAQRRRMHKAEREEIIAHFQRIKAMPNPDPVELDALYRRVQAIDIAEHEGDVKDSVVQLRFMRAWDNAHHEWDEDQNNGKEYHFGPTWLGYSEDWVVIFCGPEHRVSRWEVHHDRTRPLWLKQALRTVGW